MLQKLLVAGLLFLMLALSGRAEDHGDSVEGAWERVQRNELGKAFRIVKQHKAGQTSVTTYDEHGQVVSAHSSKYKLQNTDAVRIFTYSDVEVTAGPNKAQKVPGPFSYVYKIQQDAYYEFWGVLAGDNSTPITLIWTRVKE